MEKKKYVKPVLSSEEFVPQEYIAACGDSGKIYKFRCESSWTGLTGNTVWTNGPDGIPFTKDDVKIASTYHPCGATHEAPATDVFEKGYYRKNFLGGPAGPARKCIIWRGESGKNCHCTDNLDIDSWETLKS